MDFKEEIDYIDTSNLEFNSYKNIKYNLSSEEKILTNKTKIIIEAEQKQKIQVCITYKIPKKLKYIIGPTYKQIQVKSEQKGGFHLILINSKIGEILNRKCLYETEELICKSIITRLKKILEMEKDQAIQEIKGLDG